MVLYCYTISAHTVNAHSEHLTESAFIRLYRDLRPKRYFYIGKISSSIYKITAKWCFYISKYIRPKEAKQKLKIECNAVAVQSHKSYKVAEWNL